MSKINLVAESSSGFGAMNAQALADSGHVVYASMRVTTAQDAPQVEAVETYSKKRGVQKNAELGIVTEARYAMLDDGVGFSLVPWKPVVEQRLGQLVAATVQGSGVSWEFGRHLAR